MKKVIYIILFTSLSLSLLFNSCTKDNNNLNTTKGQVKFSFTSNVQLLEKKLNLDSTVSNSLAAAVVTIEDASGNIVQNAVTIPLENLNGNYISNPISLATGNYQLTEFLLVNQNNQVIYASPLKSSPLAYLSSNPLPIYFDIQTNIVTNIIPDVISSINYTPQDFGYATFGFKVDSTFNFLVGAFIYNQTAKNYQLTTATISVYSDSTFVYSGQLGVAGKDSVANSLAYDSLGITTPITLPAKYNSFTINISKANFATYTQTFTKAQLRQYYLKTQKGPLVVILKAVTTPNLNDGLVLYLKLSGDVLDYSGYNNNGTAYGNLTPATNYKGVANAAYYFNGVDNYIQIPDAPSLNPDSQITVSAWYYPIAFSGDGFDAIVAKITPDFVYPWYQYQLGVTGSEYINVPAHFGFSASVNNVSYSPHGQPNTFTNGKWYHLVGVNDGKNVICYVNAVPISTVPITGPGLMKDFGENILIGRSENSNFQYYYLPGTLCEIRIYNRALTQAEVTSLYNQ